MITRLALENFRSYPSLVLDDLRRMVVLTGHNGAGKTNILEAISLLAPGGGLRNVPMPAMTHRVSINTTASGSPLRIEPSLASQTPAQHDTLFALSITAFDHRITLRQKPNSNRKRDVIVNDSKLGGITGLSDYLSVLWLTPAMGTLFIDQASERRRFLDRMVYAIDPSHAGRLTRYEKILRARNRVLKDHPQDTRWIHSFNPDLAATGCAIAAARIDLAQRLASQELPDVTDFPHFNMALHGDVAYALTHQTAAQAEQSYLERLQQNLAADCQAGATQFGPHRSDWTMIWHEKNIPADQASTGEQKLLLISLVLRHAQLVTDLMTQPPILLLDDVVAHLDKPHREALFMTLDSLGAPCWMTGTDTDIFHSILGHASHIRVIQGKATKALPFSSLKTAS